MSEWKKVKLGELIVIHDKHRKPLSSMQRQKFKGKYRYYGAQGVIDYVENFIFNGDFILVAEDGENLKSRNNDIAFLVSGKFWVNNHAHIISNNENNDIKYLKYLLNFVDTSSYLTGSVQPKLSQENLFKIEYVVPLLDEQRAIADVLSALDDKIELNNKINKNLEEQAQALFKHWFVDFEFPNENGDPYKSSGGEMKDSELGLIPKDWDIGELKQVANITMGQSPSGTSYNAIEQGTVFFQGRGEFGIRFPKIRMYTTEPKRMATMNSVLLSVRAPVGDINVAQQNCCIGRGLASIESNFNHASYILHLMKNLQCALDKFNGEGTVFGSINKDALNSLKIVVPKNSLTEQFNLVAKAVDDQYNMLDFENQKLTAIRDCLLPKLMSGELRVN